VSREFGAKDAEGLAMPLFPRSTPGPAGFLLSILVLMGPAAPADAGVRFCHPAFRTTWRDHGGQVVHFAGMQDVTPKSRPASVRGTVTDPAGARVPRARVVLAGPLSVVATTETTGAGEFAFERVTPGRYDIRVAAQGFRTEPLAIVVSAGEDARVAVDVHVSAVTESVVVSAAQVELPLARAADSVTVISSAELRAGQYETIADALRLVPGLTVSRNGGRGAVTSLFPRGGESDYTLVMVDGIKANAFGGGYDFSTLSASQVERVEVVRGPESALFGADAIGAVVQVVTRHGGRPQVEGLVEGGSFGTSRVNAGTWGSHGSLGWGASAERTASNGFTGIAPATGERVSNDDFLSTSAVFSGGWRAANGADIRASARFVSGDRGFPGPYGSNPIGAYTAVDRLSRGVTRTRQVGGRWMQPFEAGGRRLRQTVSASYVDLASDFTSAYGLSASTSNRATVRAQTDVDLGGSLALSGGVEALREQATNTYITADQAGPVPIRRSVTGLFAEARYQPAAPFTLTAGVRVERIVRDPLAPNPDPWSPRPAFPADEFTSVNPRFSAAYLLAGSRAGALGWTRIHGTAGTGIRPPDALEVAFTDNPGLKPERSRSVEAGVDQAMLHEHLVVGATAFFNRYDDLIVAVGPALADASRYRTDNISNAKSQGAELSAALRAGWGLSARVSYTFLATEILAVDNVGTAPPPFQVGDPLLRRPRHVVAVDLSFARGSLTAFGHIGGRTQTLDVEPTYGTYGGLFVNPGFASVDVGASWRIARPVEVVGRIGNLFDRHYEETYGFPALGRNATLGVRIAAGR
jgi:outer membrane cobalamin receptor